MCGGNQRVGYLHETNTAISCGWWRRLTLGSKWDTLPPTCSLLLTNPRTLRHCRFSCDVCNHQTDFEFHQRSSDERPLPIKPSSLPTPNAAKAGSLEMVHERKTALLHNQFWNFWHFKVFMFCNVPVCIFCSCFRAITFFPLFASAGPLKFFLRLIV